MESVSKDIESRSKYQVLFLKMSGWFQDNEKRTPLHAAAYLGDAEIIELLILSGMILYTDFKVNHMECFDILCH